ncbi:MAG: DNA-binding protein WhiA [Candidatus Onthovivens sp.]|nr:DNA-binding protein WhiA [Candidatus Onthovivens sp.]
MEKITSFTQEIKEEICSLKELDFEKSISLLSAYIRANGSLVFKGGHDYIVLESENAKTVKFIYQLLRDILKNVDVHFSYKRTMKLNKNTKFVLEINNAKECAEFLKLDFLESKIPYRLTDKQNKIKGYFMGLFLACGSCNDPISTNYHLELALKDEDFAQAICKLSTKIKSVNFNFKIIKRRNNFIVYLKKSDLISDFLAFIEAQESCLKFEDVRVERDFSNINNRLINCDSYNYKKTIQNSNKQIEMINFIDAKLGIKNISNSKIKELCLLRIEYPEANYVDLAQFLGEKFGISVSKSSVNHLFRAIKDMARSLGYEN